MHTNPQPIKSKPRQKKWKETRIPRQDYRVEIRQKEKEVRISWALWKGENYE